MNGLIVLAVLAASTGFGLWRRAVDGRVRLLAEEDAAEWSALTTPFDTFGERGDRATIVQFSAPVCAPCRAAKRIVGEVLQEVPGVTHIELDAESHMDLVQEFGILRTPTILVLDGAGRLSARISGVPRKDELIVALDDRRFEDL